MKLVCSVECSKRDFCSAWCIAGSECRLTNFAISPQDRPKDSDHLICYSQRRHGNHIVKAIATSSNTDPNYRHPSVLTRGIYNFAWRITTALLESGSNPYMLFEFPSEVSIKTVTFHLGGNTKNHPSAQTEIRIGSSMPGGLTDFSQLELFETIDNPVEYEWRTYTADPPKKAKFLAFLETDGTNLEIAFLEVFS